MYRALRKIGLLLGVIAYLIAGCASAQHSPAMHATGMKRALAELPGSFTVPRDSGRYDYSDKLKLEEILSSQAPKLAATTLIDCIGDASPSASTLDGKPVPVGVVCYAALRQLVYYEPTDPKGDIAANWPGFLTPHASPQQLLEAKAAWQKAEKAQLLIFQ